MFEEELLPFSYHRKYWVILVNLGFAGGNLRTCPDEDQEFACCQPSMASCPAFSMLVDKVMYWTGFVKLQQVLRAWELGGRGESVSSSSRQALHHTLWKKVQNLFFKILEFSGQSHSKNLKRGEESSEANMIRYWYEQWDDDSYKAFQSWVGILLHAEHWTLYGQYFRSSKLIQLVLTGIFLCCEMGVVKQVGYLICHICTQCLGKLFTFADHSSYGSILSNRGSASCSPSESSLVEILNS